MDSNNGSALSREMKELLHAVEEGSLQDVCSVVVLGGDVHHINTSNKKTFPHQGTALYSAANRGAAAIVSYLIERGSNVDGTDDDHEHLLRFTPLMIASQKGYLEVCRILLSYKASVNAMCYGYTALSIAAEKGEYEVCSLLIEHGADVNRASIFGLNRTALLDASAKGHVDVVRLLIEKGSDVNTITLLDELSPLMLASCLGDEELCRERHYLPAVVGRNFSLGTMSREKYFEIVKLLIENGASLRNDYENWPLVLAFARGLTDFVSFILDRDPYKTEHCSKTFMQSLGFEDAILLSALNGGIDIFELLLNEVTAIRHRHLSSVLRSFHNLNQQSLGDLRTIYVTLLRAGATFSETRKYQLLNEFKAVWISADRIRSTIACLDVLLELRGTSHCSYFSWSFSWTPVFNRKAFSDIFDVTDGYLRQQFPRSLLAICRTAVLKHLPFGLKIRRQAIASLMLPTNLEKYLNFEDLRNTD